MRICVHCKKKVTLADMLFRGATKPWQQWEPLHGPCLDEVLKPFEDALDATEKRMKEREETQ